MNHPNKSVKQKLKNKELTLGSWITMADPIAVEIMAQAGFDWLAVDMEHSALTIQQAQNHIRIIELCGIEPFVRVGENNPTIIKRVMDAGARGVIVPMVNSKEEAIRAVKAVRYPPLGNRGVGLARAQKYGMGFKEYKDWINKGSVVVVQIEHIDAVNNLEEILAVEGVDAFLVGPFDLSGSIGHPGEFDHPKVKAALKKIEVVSHRMGIPSGFHVIPPDVEVLTDKINQDYKFIAFSLDILFLGTTLKEKLQSAKEVVSQSSKRRQKK